MHRQESPIKLTRPYLIVALLVLCLLAVGSAAKAVTHVGIFAGFGGNVDLAASPDVVFPGKFRNGGILHTKSGLSSFHMWSSTVFFDVDTREIDGEGSFSMAIKTAPGAAKEIIQGTWVATRFSSWRSIGLCRDNPTCSGEVGFPDGFNAGRLKARIHLFDGDGVFLGEAILTIWCSLPGIPWGPGIEQYRIQVVSGKYKGRNFEIGTHGTVFIDLSVP